MNIRLFLFVVSIIMTSLGTVFSYMIVRAEGLLYKYYHCIIEDDVDKLKKTRYFLLKSLILTSITVGYAGYITGKDGVTIIQLIILSVLSTTSFIIQRIIVKKISQYKIVINYTQLKETINLLQKYK